MPAFLLSCMLSVNGRSVSSCRNTRYAKGVSSFFHSSSVFVTFTMVPMSILGGIVLLLLVSLFLKMSRGTESILTHGLVGEQGCGRTQRETCGTRETGRKGGRLEIRVCVSSLSRLSRTFRESRAPVCSC